MFSANKTVGRSVMHIFKAETDQVGKIVDMSVRAFETDVNVGGAKGDCPPGFDSAQWHQQMAREGHLYQAMVGKVLVGAAIVFQDETQKAYTSADSLLTASIIERVTEFVSWNALRSIFHGLLSSIWIPMLE